MDTKDLSKKGAEPVAYRRADPWGGTCAACIKDKYPKQYAEYTDPLYSASDVARLIAERDAARNELETERMRLAGCGVAALGYFEGCKDEYRSASLGDVLQLKASHDALQEQVKMLRTAAANFVDPYFEEEKPSTFACHHAGESCPSCEGLVARWKRQRVLLEALAATEPKEKP